MHGKEEKELERILNITIDKVTHDFELFKFNTAIARIMELSSAINKYIDTGRKSELVKYSMEVFTKLIAPGAPSIAEEYWEKQGHNTSIFLSSWPKVDQSKVVDTEVEILIHINSKKIAVIKIDKSATKEDVEVVAKKYIDAKLNGKTIQKTIYVPGKIINYLARER